MHEPTRGERLRYAFDNFMARGTVALIAGLALASIVLVLVVGTIAWIVGIARGGDLDLFQAIWNSLMRTLDPGTMGGDTGQLGYLLLMLSVTLGGIFIVAILIGVLSSGIESRLTELRKGRSRVIETGHTVILGWSQQVFTILSELVEANANQRRPCVVVLADRDKVAMEDEIRARVPDTRSTRIVCRSGSPIDLDEIDIASVQTSRAIIVLTSNSDDPDADVIKTLLAITNDPNRRPEAYHIVAEIHDPANLDIARMVGRDEVELVIVGTLIARITAQTCRQPGLSVVYTELLDFSGDEIYQSHQPALAGRTFGEALMAFDDSTIIGLVPAVGPPMLNPPMDTVIGHDDQLLAISRDDDTIRIATESPPPIDEAAILSTGHRTLQPERTLILGWNRRGPEVVRELDHYVQPGSDITVLTSPDEHAAVEALRNTLTNQALQVVDGEPTNRVTLDSLEIGAYHHVVILSREGLDVQRADARTLVALLHLRDIAAATGHRFSIVSEMLDVRNRSLAEVTRADDFIVSDRLISLYLTQVAENKRLSAVFEDLFNASGSELFLRPATDYVEPGRPVTFYTLTAAARQRSEVAIGYRLRALSTDATKDYGVIVNPRKSDPITLSADDRLIVLATN
jgi:voltage-gated potassium channel Kch